jgi:ABC-type lipoprotein export system ATPase subunit
MLIELENGSVRYGDRLVLDHVSCGLRPGQLTVVMGPSGSGKSTLLGVLGGITPLDSGTLRRADGLTVAWMSQTTVVFRRRNALDNVAIGAYRWASTVSAARHEAARVLDELRVGHLADRPGVTLSGGEQQRIAVARALASRAELLLSDEPTVSLDRSARDRLLETFVVAARRGLAVLIATHDPVVAERADELWTLRDGALEIAGPS